MVAKEVRAKVEASQLLNTSAAISRGGISFGARDVVKNPSVSWWSRERRLLLISDERMKDSGDCNAEITLQNNNNQNTSNLDTVLDRTALRRDPTAEVSRETLRLQAIFARNSTIRPTQRKVLCVHNLQGD